MNLKKVKETIDKIVKRHEPNVTEELGRISRDLGHELSRNNLKFLREWRGVVACAISPLEKDNSGLGIYIRGVIFGILEVCAAYEANLEADLDKYDVLCVAKSSPHKEILLALNKHTVLNNKELTSYLNLSEEEIEGPLSDLMVADLVVGWKSPIKNEVIYRLDGLGYSLVKDGRIA